MLTFSIPEFTNCKSLLRSESVDTTIKDFRRRERGLSLLTINPSVGYEKSAGRLTRTATARVLPVPTSPSGSDKTQKYYRQTNKYQQKECIRPKKLKKRVKKKGLMPVLKERSSFSSTRSYAKSAVKSMQKLNPHMQDISCDNDSSPYSIHTTSDEHQVSILIPTSVKTTERFVDCSSMQSTERKSTYIDEKVII